jgi:uroporphyrinogen III methyltransferase/synthase
MSSGRVTLVGAGPGDPGLLTLRAAQVLADADVLLYDALASDPIIEMTSPRCERIFVGKRSGDHAMPQSEIEALMVRKAREGNHVVRLKGGDPFVFGRGGEEALALRAQGITFEVVPGITSAIAVPAYAGIPVTQRGMSAAFTVLTGHEDPSKLETMVDWKRLADPDRTLVLLMAMERLPQICARLIEEGMSPDTPSAVIQDGTRPSQRCITATLRSIAVDAQREGLVSPAIVVIGEVVALRNDLRWFDVMPLFGKSVLLTRPAPQNETVARALRARGAQPLYAPTIAIASPDDPTAERRALEQLSRYQWIVFGSQNGVDAFFARLAELGRDARFIGSTRIAAIGSKTAQRLGMHGVRADLVPTPFVAEALASALIDATRPADHLMIYGAEQSRDVLAKTLELAGRTTTVVSAYKTVFHMDPHLEQTAARADAWTFTSASTVTGFAQGLGGADAVQRLATGKIIACIGPITAQAAHDVGMTVHVRPEESTTAAMIDALEACFARDRSVFP